MPVIKKMKNVSKTGENKSKDLKKSEEKKYKKSKDSDSDGDNYKSSGSDNDNDIEDGVSQRDNGGKFDIHEYRKMLGEMFPSKYMNKRIATLENNKKNKQPQALQDTHESNEPITLEVSKMDTKKTTSSSGKKTNTVVAVVDENKKVTRSSAKAAAEQSKLKENKPVEKSKKKGSHNPPPVDDDKAKEEYDTSSTSTNCSDDDYSDESEDPYSAGFGEFAKEQLKNGKFNIVINLLNDKKNHGQHEDEDSEYDSEEEWGSEYDDDEDEYDSDSEYDDDEDEDEDDYEDDSEDDPNYHPDEDEDAVSGDIKGYKYKDNKTTSGKTSKNFKGGSGSGSSHKVSDKKSSAKVHSSTTDDVTESNGADSLETIQKIIYINTHFIL
jgi:hypothetical protein